MYVYSSVAMYVVSALPNGYPGSVLMKIAFAASDEVTHIEDWEK